MSPPPSAATRPARFSALRGPLGYLRSLWLGEFPLGRALCFDMLVVGTVVNLATFVGAILLFSGDTPDAYGVALLLVHIPYNLLVFTGVWRSADAAPAGQAWGARSVALVWLIVFFVL